MGINQMHFDMVMSLFLMNITIETLAPKSFVKAVVQPDWHPPIIKELDNFCENTCFQWIKDTGQRRLFMIWLFSFKSDMSKKARMVIDGLYSTSAHVGYIGHQSVVSFTSKTQGSLSTSTAESEIKAVNQCLKEEALAMKGMLNLMGFPQDATIIEDDNQACVYASEIPHLTRGIRHLDLAEMLIKEKVEPKEIKLLKVASVDNTSDLGTKRLALPLFNKLTSRIIDKSLRVNL